SSPERTATVKQRNIFLWYVISILTIGIGFVVWYYHLNADAKKLARHNAWSPGLSVVAVTLGAFLIIPPLVSHWGTWSRVREATDVNGLPAGLQFCLCFIPLVNIAYYGYLQSKLNQAVGVELAAGTAATAIA